MNDGNSVAEPILPCTTRFFTTDDVAYIKAVKIKDETFYAVYDAEGNALTAFDTRDVAFATASQNNLKPSSAH